MSEYPRDFTREKAIEYFEKILDQLDKKRVQLENTSNNLWNMIISNHVEKIKAIYNTGSNSAANDLFIEQLNLVQQELNSDFPYVPLIKDRINNAQELFFWAVGKTAQHDQQQIDKAINIAQEQISFSRKPYQIYYNKHQKEQIKDYKDYED